MKRPKLGPTGDYPSGKFGDADEGGIRIAVGSTGGKVVVDFGSPVAWIGLNPTEARQIATALTEHAVRAETQRQ